MHKSRYLNYAEWNDVLQGKINADLLVMGTSRAWKDVSPRILDSSLGINSYNIGMDGAAFELQYERLQLYLQHNRKPKYILQEAGLPTFSVSEESQYFEQYIPYLGDPVIWKMARKHVPSLGPAERYFPLYKYNNQLPLIKEGIRSYFGHGAAATKYKGYEGVESVWDSSFFVFKQLHPEGVTGVVDTPTLVLFKSYLRYCQANDIKVILFYSPTYYEYYGCLRNFKTIDKMIADCAAENGMLYLDYSSDTMNHNKAYFYNSQHLNRQGAELFNRKMAGDLKKYLP